MSTLEPVYATGTEGINHLDIKKRAMRLLTLMGFQEGQIHFEHTVLNGKAKGLVVDVLGKKDDFTIAIECGNCSIEKLILLESTFDEVLWLPYYGKNTERIAEKANRLWMSMTKKDLEIEIEKRFRLREERLSRQAKDVHEGAVQMVEDLEDIRERAEKMVKRWRGF